MLYFYFHICRDESNLESTELGWKMKCRNTGRDGHMSVGAIPLTVCPSPGNHKKDAGTHFPYQRLSGLQALQLGNALRIVISLSVSSKLLV